MISGKSVAVLTVATVLAAMALPVFAQGEGGPAQGERRRRPGGPAPADRERRMARMAEADKNGDGQISFDEFVEARTKEMKDAFTRLDTNGDGVLSKDDRREAPPRGEGEGRRARDGGADGEQPPPPPPPAE